MQMAVWDALIAFVAASAQAQAEATKEAQRAGIEHAKAREDAYLGRKPSFTAEQLTTIRDMLASGSAIGGVARATGLSRQAIYRIQADADLGGATARAVAPHVPQRPLAS
jgi:putative DNA-invertase from lambdoid prophage Rac